MSRIICYLLGHRWNGWPYKEEDALKGWSYEWHKCDRCGAIKRELWAGKLG